MNPEDHVVDEIAALIDEQLEAGWRDDYDTNLYPDCDNCPHDWHGVTCSAHFCKCEGSTGEVPKPELEYVDQVESVRRGFDCDYMEFDDGDIVPVVDGAPWLPLWHADQVRASRGYTIRDLEAMRNQIYSPRRSGVRMDRLQQTQPRQVLRFWAQCDDGTFLMVEGVAELMHVVMTRDCVSVMARLDEVRHRNIGEDDEEQPVGPVVDDMISMECATIPEGFQPIGYLSAEDLEVETTREMWEMGTTTYLQERCEITMQFGVVAGLEWLNGGADGGPPRTFAERARAEEVLDSARSAGIYQDRLGHSG